MTIPHSQRIQIVKEEILVIREYLDVQTSLVSTLMTNRENTKLRIYHGLTQEAEAQMMQFEKDLIDELMKKTCVLEDEFTIKLEHSRRYFMNLTDPTIEQEIPCKETWKNLKNKDEQ